MFRELHGSLVEEWTTEIPNEGLLCYHDLFNVERVVPTSPKALAEVLVTKSQDFTKPKSIRKLLGAILGDGLLISEGDDHKMQRKGLMPAFAYRHVKDLYPLFWSKAQEFTHALEEEITEILLPVADDAPPPHFSPGFREPSAVIEMTEWLNRFAFDMIGLAALGLDFDSVQHPEIEIFKAFEALFSPSIKSCISMVISSSLPSMTLPYLSFNNGKGIVGAKRCITETFQQLIMQKRTNLDTNKRADLDILSIAMQSGNFTDSELVDQMMSFLAAGPETVTSALSWAVYILTTNPVVQKRLREEIQAEFPSYSDTEAPFSSASIDSLPYLQAFTSELLRLHAPIPLNFREAVADTSILGQHIPKGTSIIVGNWATNRSHELWGPDAREFNPDRWLGAGRMKNGGATSNYAYMTFGHGARSCIGQGFARAEVACCVAALVQRLEFTAVEKAGDLELKGDIIVRPRVLKVRIRKV